VGAAPSPRPTPAPKAEPQVPDIHGWPADKIQALQKAAAQALGRPAIFRDAEFQVRRKERVKTGERKRWFADPEPIYEEREVVKANNPPEMVVIPAGSFLMGSREGEPERSDDEGPQHRVTLLRPFAIGRYAVTFEEYDAFCSATGRDKPGDQGWGRARQPVINVSWDDAVAYCQWLSGQTGKPYRLPSEAEWEYAARAGTKTPFHFGATLSTAQANYNGNRPYRSGAKGEYRQCTVAVGTLPANAWGLYEVHGNVWEWVQDCWHDSYEGATVDGSAWQVNCVEARRVLRGGSWSNDGWFVRVSFRYGDDAGTRDFNLGLRLAQDL
jgi:formylglycine-generating enzyme required for sulfatase activity